MTLVELLVVLAIFVLVAGLTIFDYGKFRSNVSLQNLADDIALSVRRAQGEAIGVGSSLSSFSNGYGIHFSTSTIPLNPLSGSNKLFVLFNDIADRSGTPNKLYDYDPSSRSSLCDATTLRSGNECLDLLNITSADEIAFICPNGDVNNCTANYADIVFLRPNPDACIHAGSSRNIRDVIEAKKEDISNFINFDVTPESASIENQGGGIHDNPSTCSGGLRSVDIVVRNIQSGDTKTITVSSIGQISVK